MDPEYAELMKSLAAELRLARENPHTDLVLSVINWTILPLLILCLLPCILRVRRTGRLSSGILSSWGGLLLFYIWLCMIAPLLAVKWTGDSRTWHNFPEGPAVAGIAVIGWWPLTFLSLVQWLLQWLLGPVRSTVARWLHRS